MYAIRSYYECKEKLKEKVIEKIDLSRVCEDEEVREIIDEMILEESALYYISLSVITSYSIHYTKLYEKKVIL